MKRTINVTPDYLFAEYSGDKFSPNDYSYIHIESTGKVKSTEKPRYFSLEDWLKEERKMIKLAFKIFVFHETSQE